MNDLLIGSQEPTLLFEPPASDWSLGDLAVEWAETVAGYRLYPWQKFCVRSILARRADGLWAARDACLEVTRQQGKNVVLEVLELFLVFELGCRLLVHSAHRADTSAEHFIRLQERIKSVPDLMDLMPGGRNDGFYTGNGKEAIWLDPEKTDGVQRRILFKARQSNAGRGPSPQVIVLDEAFDCAPSAIGSLAPSLTAQRNPMILFSSSAPKASSLLLHDLAKRAEEADPEDRLLYIGWRARGDVDPESIESITKVSPSLGLGLVTLESIKANKKLLRRFPGEFEREHLGVAELPDDDQDGPIPLDVWAGLAQVSVIDSHQCWALAVSPDRKWASLGKAGRTADGKVHVEWVEHKAGTGWIVERAQYYFGLRPIPLRIHKGGPEAALIEPLRAAKVEVLEIGTPEVAQATGQFIDHVANRTIAHIAQPSLDKAISGAALRLTPDGASLWSQRRSAVEITPLQAVTVALGGVPIEVPAQRSGRVY